MTIWEALPELSTYVGKKCSVYDGHYVGILESITIGEDDVYYVMDDGIWYSAVGGIYLVEENKDG